MRKYFELEALLLYYDIINVFILRKCIDFIHPNSLNIYIELITIQRLNQAIKT